MAKDFNLDDLPDLPGGTAVDELPDLPVENVPRLGTIPRSNDLPSLLRNPRLGRSPMVPAVPSRLHAVLAGAAPDQPIAALPDDGLQARLPGPSRGDSYLARATGQPDPLEAIGEGPGSAIPLGPEASERLKALRPDLVAQSQPTNLQFAGSALMGAALSIPKAVYDLGYGGLGLTHALGLTSDADLAEAARSRRDFSAGLDELTGTGSGSVNPGKNIMDLGSGLLPFALPVVGTALGAAGMAGTGEADAIEAGATRGQAALAALFEGTAGAVLPKIGKMAAPALEAMSSRIGDALAQQVMRETASPFAAKIAAETVAKGLEGAAHGELANTLLSGAGAAGQSAYDPEGAQARLKAGMGDQTLALLGALPGAARGLVAPDGVNLAPAYTSREMAPGGPYDRLRTADADLARVQRDIPDTHPADQAITPATEVAGTKGLGPADEATLAHRDTFTPMAEAAELPDMPARTGGQLREAPIADAKAVQAQIDAEDAAFEKAMKTRRNDTNAGETQALGELDTGAFEPVRPPEPDTAQKFNTAPLSTDTGLHRAGFITPDEADARKAAERAGGADETRVSEPIRPGATDDANAAALPDQRLHPEQPRPAAGGDQPLEVAGDDGSRAGPGGGRDEGGAEAAQQPGRDGAAAGPEAAPFHPAIQTAIDRWGVTDAELKQRASSQTNDTLGEALAKYPVGDDPHGATGNAEMLIAGSRRYVKKMAEANTKPKETTNAAENPEQVQPGVRPAEGQAGDVRNGEQAGTKPRDVPQAGRQEEAAAAGQPGEGARPPSDVGRKGEKPPEEPPVKPGQQELPLPKEGPELSPGGDKDQRPDLMNPGRNPVEQHAMITNESRTEKMVGESVDHDDLRTKAKERVDTDAEKTLQSIKDRLNAGENPTPQDHADLKELFNRETDRSKKMAIGTLWKLAGERAAQSLGARKAGPGELGQMGQMAHSAHSPKTARQLDEAQKQIRALLAEKARLEAAGPSDRRKRVQSAKKTAMAELADLGRQLHRALTNGGSAGALGGEPLEIMGKMLTKAVKVAGLSVADAVLYITDHVPAFRHDPEMHKKLEEAKAAFLKENPGTADPGKVADLIAKDADARAEKRAKATIKRYEALEEFHKKENADLEAMTPEERLRYIQGEAAKDKLPDAAQAVVDQHKANIKELREERDRKIADVDGDIATERKRIDDLLAKKEAENRKLAAMTREQREAYLRAELERTGHPNPTIEQMREDNAGFLKQLNARKAELVKAAKSPDAKIAAEEQRIATQVEGWKARRDALANQTVEQRRKAKLDRQPDPILKGMRDQARKDHADLLKEIRDLNNPKEGTHVDSPAQRDLDRRIKQVQDRVDRITVESVKDMGKRAAHLKRSGFDVDDENATWRKSKEGLEAFIKAEDASRGDWTDTLRFHRMAMLHGWTSVGKKLLTDSATILSDKLVLKPLEALINSLPGGTKNGETARSSLLAIKAMWPALKMAFKAFPAAYGQQKGHDYSGSDVQDYNHFLYNNGRYGNILSHISGLHAVKALQAAMETFSSAMDVGRYADRLAVNDVGDRLTGDAYHNHMKESLANPDSPAWKAAMDRAAKDTYTDRVAGLQWLMRIKNGHPDDLAGKAAKVVANQLIPFATIDSNLFKKGVLNGIPVVSDALTLAKWANAIHGKAFDRNMVNRDLAKAATRWAAYGLFGALNRATGFLTGDQDKDSPTPAYSINFLGHHFSYKHLGPLGYMLGAIADMSTAEKGGELRAEWDGLLHRGGDISILQAYTDLHKAYLAQDGWLKYGAKQAENMVYPQALRQVGAAYNYAVNQASPRRMSDQWQGQAPGNGMERMLSYMLENADVPGFFAKSWKNPVDPRTGKPWKNPEDATVMKPEQFEFKGGPLTVAANFIWKLFTPMGMGLGKPGAKLNSLPDSPRQGQAGR